MRGLVLSALVLCACATWFPAPVPMRKVEWRQSAAQARCLIVFLPGLGDDAEDFERNGFVDEVTRRGLSVDLIAAQATLGYYARGTFPARLATDVVGPALTRGYAQVWLIGVSMGGMGTLYYSRVQTAQITGILALAPYLGDRDLSDEIRNHGGLPRWPAPPRVEVMNQDNYQRELWRWLQAVTLGQERGPTIYVGYGTSDKLARQDELLAAALPPDHVYRIDGAHDWETWKALLRKFLQSSELDRDCRLPVGGVAPSATAATRRPRRPSARSRAPRDVRALRRGVRRPPAHGLAVPLAARRRGAGAGPRRDHDRARGRAALSA